MHNPSPQKKRRLWHSFADAFRGIGCCIKSERNMRIHLVACAYVLFFASQLSLSRGEMACLLLAIGGVMTAETLNTALEKLCDFAQKNLNRYIRVIKDMAAGAVLLSAAGGGRHPLPAGAVGAAVGDSLPPGGLGAAGPLFGGGGGVYLFGARLGGRALGRPAPEAS